jgi:hypothetical protein
MAALKSDTRVELSFHGRFSFGRVEVRRRTRFPSMVALSNPVWLQPN